MTCELLALAKPQKPSAGNGKPIGGQLSDITDALRQMWDGWLH
jgi:hypothetical protein